MRSERRILTSLFQGGLLCALAVFSLFCEAAGATANIVLVVSDDHSKPHMGCYGDVNVKTPRFDQFAAQSLRFTRAYTTAPQCAPSRKSIFTGRSPVGLQQTLFTLPMQSDIPLFPDLMKGGAGYHTGLVGRSHHLDGHYDEVMNEIAERHQLRTATRNFDVVLSADGATGNIRSINSIAQYKSFLDGVPGGKPFFVQLGFSDPHRDWDQDFHPFKHDPAKLKLPAHYPDTPQLRADLAAYYDEVGRLDHYFGIAMDELEKRELVQNTIVIFMGDNGSATLRGKGTLYEGGLNVPFLVRWPGVATPAVSDVLISGEDLAPTLLEAVGLPVPPGMTGMSFLPVLKGLPFEPRTYVFAERGAHVGYPRLQASDSFDLARTVIGGRFKLIYNAIPSIPYTPTDFTRSGAWRSIERLDKKGKLQEPFKRLYRSKTRPIFELYDLKKDPSELTNLAEVPYFIGTRLHLQKMLVEWMVLEKDFLPLPLPGVQKAAGGGDD